MEFFTCKLKDKLEKIEKKIEDGTLEDKDGVTLLEIRTTLEKSPDEKILDKYYEIIEKLIGKLPAKTIESGKIVELKDSVFIRVERTKLKVEL